MTAPQPRGDQIATRRGLVNIVDGPEDLARDAADRFVEITTAAAAERGRAFVALSGGSTPRRMGELLDDPNYRDQVPWHALELFWGDERWVPQQSPESNAGVAKRTFVDQVPIPPTQVHPFPTDLDSADAAADAYAATIRHVFGVPTGLPRFDLIYLGIGEDGHTASLFPGTAALGVRRKLAVRNFVPKLDAERLTLTVPLLNAARTIVVLAAGRSKAQALAAILNGPADPNAYPAQLIEPTDGELVWLVDREAASRLR